MPSPRKYSPDVTPPARASIAACWVVCPVPPFAIPTVPVTFAAVPVTDPEIGLVTVNGWKIFSLLLKTLRMKVSF